MHVPIQDDLSARESLHGRIPSSSMIDAHGLCARAITYKYRYCPKCQREWPAQQTSCPVCSRWLGDRALERLEWQLAPSSGQILAPTTYELISASAITLRVISEHPPRDALREIADALKDVFAPAAGISVCGVREHGWLSWTVNGLRHAFLGGLEIEKRLRLSVSRLDKTCIPSVRLRWGILLDQYVLPLDQHGHLVISDLTATAIFTFEPNDLLLSSETVYQTNKRWENFVCVPHRLLDETEAYGYRLIGHKRPSALDHARVADSSPFVGRENELVFLDVCRLQSRNTHLPVALIADAGSGKSRLMREWIRRDPSIRALSASFSLFGGDVVSLASQLASLPSDDLSSDALLASILARIEDERIDVVVLDDLHWADPDGRAFVRLLLDTFSSRKMLILLVSRPSGSHVLQMLRPAAELRLMPLAVPAIRDLARQLIASESVAEIAARRSGGNPLFMEQFAAWALEVDYEGGDDGPRNLHQAIAARIAYLSGTRLSRLRQRLTWGPSWERELIVSELDQIEAEIGLWLDRLETGDYADRVEASRHLAALEHVDFEIFMISTLAGKPRPRSNRLREAIERLFIGSAEQILTDLEMCAVEPDDTGTRNIYLEAERTGDRAMHHMRWTLAEHFYELARRFAEPRQKGEIDRHLAECRLRSQVVVADESTIEKRRFTELDLEKRPSVDCLRLPEIWIHLGERHASAKYFLRAAEAAEAINDRALAALASARVRQLSRT
jgi:hypothetical protein